MTANALELLLTYAPHSAAGLLAAVLLAIVYRRVTEDTSTAAVIGQLRDELARLGKLNADLMEAVGKLQQEVFQLRGQNFELREEVAKLNMQLTVAECATCPHKALA